MEPSDNSGMVAGTMDATLEAFYKKVSSPHSSAMTHYWQEKI